MQGGAWIKLGGVLGEKRQPQEPWVGAAPTEEKDVCAQENTALDTTTSVSSQLQWMHPLSFQAHRLPGK